MAMTVVEAFEWIILSHCPNAKIDKEGAFPRGFKKRFRAGSRPETVIAAVFLADFLGDDRLNRFSVSVQSTEYKNIKVLRIDFDSSYIKKYKPPVRRKRNDQRWSSPAKTRRNMAFHTHT